MGIYTIILNCADHSPEIDDDQELINNKVITDRAVEELSKIEGTRVMKTNEWSIPTVTFMCIKNDVLQRVVTLFKEKNLGEVDNADAFRVW